MKHKLEIFMGSIFSAGIVAILYMQSQGVECINCARMGA